MRHPPLWRPDMRLSGPINGDLLHYRRNEDGPRLLDLGCGDGTRAIALASRAFNQVTALDATESLIELAQRRAAKRRAAVTFVCGDPWATPFMAAQFDEVMLLGDLFGHSSSLKSDVDLLREARRVLQVGGRLHLSFSDGDWIRRHFSSKAVEGLPTGFIYRRRSLSADGHSMRTTILSSGDDYGIARQSCISEWLYTPRDVTEVLHLLGFEAIVYDDASQEARSRLTPDIPRFVVHCRAGRPSAVLRTVGQ